MANIIKCDIVTPDAMVFRGEAVMVSAPAAEGDIGMMYQCAPLMSTLRRGAVRIKSDNDETITFAVDGGYLEMDGSKVVVLASRAIDASQIEPSFAQERITLNEKRINELAEDDPARAFAEAEIAWQKHLLTFA